MNILPHKRYKALLIGDSCIDVYHYGTCSRLSPEAPVPIFKENRWEERPGMAANVLANLKAFNIEVKFITNDKKIGIYDDTFENNLFLGNKRTDELIKRAKKLVGIFYLNEIESNFSSLLTFPLGENGKRLSGGQVKRLCLARSLLIDTKVLVWDAVLI